MSRHAALPSSPFLARAGCLVGLSLMPHALTIGHVSDLVRNLEFALLKK
uniref:Uncharacterized protein n=1 Tax=Setaria viridis TaxID=4556 RepID=A0A4U6SYM9_SETVI|nr:hypothetical protein SEVIR_9G282500v2 [Setaria viridis]